MKPRSLVAMAAIASMTALAAVSQGGRQNKVGHAWRLLKKFSKTLGVNVRDRSRGRRSLGDIFEFVNHLPIQNEAELRDLLVAMSRPIIKNTDHDPVHMNYHYFADKINEKMDYSLLEIGARDPTGNGVGYKSWFHGCNNYVGFDILPGPNVDVVGDIHELSYSFPDQRFDGVFAISTFEHLAMPWKAVLEINKVMNMGGLLYISTHPTWPPHSLPWDFWRFSPQAFDALLNPATGFEILLCADGLPCMILPLAAEESMKTLHQDRACLSVSVVARKIGEPKPNLSWDVPVEEILKTMYPES